MDDELIETNQQFSVNGINGSKIESLNVSKLRAGSVNVDEYLQSTGYVAGSTGWRINGDGSVEFDSGYFRGDITGATGTFSGTITGGSLNIPDTTTANSFHVETDGDTFWGTTPALFTSNNENATSYILKTGAARFSSVKITGLASGSSLDGQYFLVNSVASASAKLALRGWTQTCAFTVTDADTIAWGAGTLTASDGTAYSIGASNTGNMVAKTYIYLDIGVSTTAYQVTTTATTAIGDGKLLIAIAQNGTGEATFFLLNNNSYNIDAANIVAGSITANEIAAATITGAKIAATTITAANITALTITAAEIAANTITAGKMSVTDLSAISANIGSITSGSITVVNGGNTIGFTPAGSNAIFSGTTGSPEFRVTPAGALTATSATITGAITATSGAIGAWTINSTSIYTGTEDHSGYTANAGDMTLYSNGTDASIHANKFYIDSAGVLNCTAAIVAGAVTTTSGSSVDGTYLVPYTVTSGKAALALVGWTQTCAFTVTDADTIAWGSGTLTLSDGTAYSISAGNTGNMAAKTYIYLDVGVSTTVYQTTTTAATAIGDDKILLAIAQNGTGEATFMLLNNNSYNIDAANIVAGSITANEIAASTITANKIATNTITANELTTGAFVTTTANITDAIITSAKISDLSVAKLTAGTISSKAITLAITAGTGDTYIAAGKTDFDNTQSGFILGLDDSDSDRAKFYIGNTTEYLNWDGVNLTVTGTSLINAPASKTFTAGEALTANDAVIIAPTATETYQITQTTTDNTRRLDVTTDKVGQTFTTRKYDTQKILSFIFSMSKTGSPGNITFDLHATSGGLPTGAALSSVTLTSASFSGSLADITIDFSPDVSLSSNTMYAVVFYGVSLTGANYYSFADNFASVYSGGTAVWYNGSIWQTSNGRGGNEEYFKVNMSEVPTTTGSVYQAEADSPYTYYYNNFIGFNQSTVAAAGTARIISSGIMAGFTGLTPGAIYYLSDTAGAISSSAGTNSVKIGRAVSTTELLIVIPPL